MSLQQDWEDSVQQPFQALVPKERQFLVGFTLLLIGEGIEDPWYRDSVR